MPQLDHSVDDALRALHSRADEIRAATMPVIELPEDDQPTRRETFALGFLWGVVATIGVTVLFIL